MIYHILPPFTFFKGLIIIIFQLCPLIIILYTIFKALYSRFAFIIVENIPIVNKGSLGKVSCVLTTSLHFLICLQKP
jgi:hypothetical protein